MRRAFLVSILIFSVIGGYTPLYSIAETNYNLPTKPVKQPRVVYLKWGKKLICDYVWKDGDIIFVVVRGKKFAVGYNPSEIDMKRSFGPVPKGSFRKEIKGAPVVELYEKSGMGALIEQIANLYISGLAQHRGNLPPYIFNALERAGRDAFNATKMRKKVLEVLEHNLDPELAREVLGWLRSPLGQGITALEGIQFTPEKLQEIQTFGRQIQNNPPTQKRLELVRRLDSATGASEKNAEVALTILLQTVTGMENALHKEQKMGMEKINREVELRRPQILENAKKSTEISFIYIYQSLADDELDRYVSFLESKTGRDYNAKTFEAFMAALSDAAEENGKTVAKILSDLIRRDGG